MLGLLPEFNPNREKSHPAPPFPGCSPFLWKTHILLLGVMPNSFSHSLAARSWGGPLFQPLSVQLHLINAKFCSVNEVVGLISLLARRVLPVTPLLLSKGKKPERSQHVVLPRRPREEQS